MADTPLLVKPDSMMPYIWAALIFFLLGITFIMGLLYLRPTLDPLILITAVIGAMGTMFTGAAAFMKSQETHLTVNSQLTSWKAEFFAMAHAQGVIAGTETEQARIAEQKRIDLIASGPVAWTPSTAEPLPVKVVAAVPVPVTETKTTPSAR